jgi:hypothetical protein
MNGVRGSVRILLASLAMLYTGCLEIETTTTVHTDGSFTREIESTGEDSTKGSDLSPLFLTDSTWTVVRRKTSDTTWATTVSREFRDANALAAGLKGMPGQSLEIRIGAQKEFRWFTTSYAYSETLLCYNHINAVPFSRYLTQNEMEFWLRHQEGGKSELRSAEDSLAYERIERISSEWDARNKFEAFLDVFVQGVKEANDPGLTVQDVTAESDSLYAHCAPILGQSTEMSDTLRDQVERVLGTPVVKKVFAANSRKFQALNQKMKFAFDMLTAPYKKVTIVMPGFITSTNAESITGNRLEWKNFMAKPYVMDYAMWAQSRVINWWAVIVTGAVLILLTVLLVVGVFRRRRAVA